MSKLKSAETRAQALMSTLSSRQLVRALLVLEGKERRSAEEKLTRSWLCGALEKRYPQVVPTLDAWAEAVEGPLSELSYGEALIAALPPQAIAA